MYGIITFATHWGSLHGGINSFNRNLILNFHKRYKNRIRILCFINSKVTPAQNENEKIRSFEEEGLWIKHQQLHNMDEREYSEKEDAENALGYIDDFIKSYSIAKDKLMVVGHDCITGEIALEVSHKIGCKCTIINHMNYESYKYYMGDSEKASIYEKRQSKLFNPLSETNSDVKSKNIDFHMSVGPLLAQTFADHAKLEPDEVHQLIPGLDTERTYSNRSRTLFKVLTYGRFNADTEGLKNGSTLIDAFQDSYLTILKDHRKTSYKVIYLGIDEEYKEYLIDKFKEKFSDEYSLDSLHSVYFHKYETEKDEILRKMDDSHVVVMPSKHEGFGLVAWEAIELGVPVIIGRETGVYELLKEHNLTGFVEVISFVSYNKFKVKQFSHSLEKISERQNCYNDRALILRDMLSKIYTWSRCIDTMTEAWGWKILKNLQYSDNDGVDIPEAFLGTDGSLIVMLFFKKTISIPTVEKLMEKICNESIKPNNLSKSIDVSSTVQSIILYIYTSGIKTEDNKKRRKIRNKISTDKKNKFKNIKYTVEFNDYNSSTRNQILNFLKSKHGELIDPPPI